MKKQPRNYKSINQEDGPICVPGKSIYEGRASEVRP